MTRFCLLLLSEQEQELTLNNDGRAPQCCFGYLGVCQCTLLCVQLHVVLSCDDNLPVE